MAQCDFLDWGPGIFGSYRCRKNDDKELDKNTVNTYCDNSLAYRDCPIYKGSSSSGGCYLTTACVDHMGLADDCMELSTLRSFRDGYMSELEQGKEDIQEYYRTAPEIVKAIDESGSADDVYSKLYSDVIVPCVSMIKEEKNQEAYEKYKEMVLFLEKEYNI